MHPGILLEPPARVGRLDARDVEAAAACRPQHPAISTADVEQPPSPHAAPGQEIEHHLGLLGAHRPDRALEGPLVDDGFVVAGGGRVAGTEGRREIAAGGAAYGRHSCFSRPAAAVVAPRSA